MYKLYHHPLCPFSRKIRIFLAAKEIKFELINENFWERKKDFLAINPASTVPVLIDNESNLPICYSLVIIEYIEEKHDKKNNFIGQSLIQKAEIRRIQNWFDEKFYLEVSKYILNERYFNRFLLPFQTPNSETLRVARHNLNIHLSYIEYLIENRKYLGGEEISVADFAAAGHISALDYFGDINWSHYEEIKNWYSLVKSHKFFSEILKDRIAGIIPSQNYSKLDF
jgi:glutathione S-transferase